MKIKNKSSLIRYFEKIRNKVKKENLLTGNVFRFFRENVNLH